jgi:hypothetical protein
MARNKMLSMVTQIKKRQDAVAKERDRLDDMICELEGLRDCSQRAWDCLQDARDALSELV